MTVAFYLLAVATAALVLVVAYGWGRIDGRDALLDSFRWRSAGLNPVEHRGERYVVVKARYWQSNSDLLAAHGDLLQRQADHQKRAALVRLERDEAVGQAREQTGRLREVQGRLREAEFARDAAQEQRDSLSRSFDSARTGFRRERQEWEETLERVCNESVVACKDAAEWKGRFERLAEAHDADEAAAVAAITRLHDAIVAAGKHISAAGRELLVATDYSDRPADEPVVVGEADSDGGDAD